MQRFLNFGEKLQKLLNEKGYTQRSFADVLKVEHAQINMWCKGKRNPTPKTVKKISEALGVPVAYFVGEDNSVSQQANGNAGNVSQSVALGGGDVGAKLEVVNAKLEAITAKLDVLLERTKGK